MAEKKVQVVNTDHEHMNPVSEDAVTLLRRILKVLESNSVVDSSCRQRVVVDSGSIAATATFAANQDIRTVTTVTTVTGLTNLSGVDSKWLLVDTARNAYANGIRSKLSW